MTLRRPTAAPEAGEQIAVVRELRRMSLASGGRVRYFAVPNGGSRQPGERARLAAQGVIPGVPDLLVLGGMPQGAALPLTGAELTQVRQSTTDPLVQRLLATLDARSGFALELKRVRGTRSDVGAEQADWLSWFGGLGWGTGVGFGAEDALRKLAAAGYDVRTTGQ